MRVIKDHEERRNEILDAAEQLFHTKGYKNCTVNDILNVVSIAKGTFYYYFKSKEEVLDAVVERFGDIITQRGEAILAQKDVSPADKLLYLFGAMNISDQVDGELLEEVHKAENAIIHQKTLNQAVNTLAPMMAKVIEEGQEQKLWTCKYPLRYMQIILTASISLTDEGIFQQSEKDQEEIMVAIVTLVEQMLQLPEGMYLQKFVGMFSQEQE